MATVYPTSGIDNYPNVVSGNPFSAMDSSSNPQHVVMNNYRDAIKAIETYAGTNPIQGGDVTSLTYQIQQLQNISSNTGAITSPTTYTYSSFSAPTVVLTPAADPTGYLDVGMIFRFTITGVNAGTYTGYVTAVASNSVSVILDSSVAALATGTVSAVVFSRSSLHGFNGWLAWTPTYGGDLTMTYTSVTTTEANFLINGRTLYYKIDTSAGTTGGSASTAVNFTLPIPRAVNGIFIGAGSSYVNDGGTTYLSLPFFKTSDASKITVYNFNAGVATNFGLGTGRVFGASGFYQI